MNHVIPTRLPLPMSLWVCAAIVGVLMLAGCEQEAPTPSPPAATPADVTANTGAEQAEHHDESAAHLPVVSLEEIKALITETSARDQVLVIDFWATWCVPCVEMFPSLHEGLIARGEAVRAVTVTLDDPSREGSAIKFLKEHDAMHDAYIFKNDSAAQQALADGLSETWNNLGVPAIMVYHTDGTQTGEFLEGGSTDDILAHVDELLASQD